MATPDGHLSHLGDALRTECLGEGARLPRKIPNKREGAFLAGQTRSLTLKHYAPPLFQTSHRLHISAAFAYRHTVNSVGCTAL